MTEIDKDIPIPKNKYPFREIEVGESFSVDNAIEPTLRSLASYYKKRYGFNYTVKRVSETQMRVWRTK